MHAMMMTMTMIDERMSFIVAWTRITIQQDAVLSQGEISIGLRIEFCNGIVRFLCHSTSFLLVFFCRLQ